MNEEQSMIYESFTADIKQAAMANDVEAFQAAIEARDAWVTEQLGETDESDTVYQ